MRTRLPKPLPNRPSPAWLLLPLLTACAGTPAAPPPPAEAPEVPLVTRWPAGQRFRATLAARVPDQQPWRAALVWWREALRQSVAFVADDGPDDGAIRGLPVLELDLDAAGGTLVATLRDADGARVLAGGRFDAEQLPAAIDRLAWAARLALGEAAAAPLPVGPGTSPQPLVCSAVDDAMQLLRDGGLQPAWRALRDARARDGGAPFVLDGTAALQLLRGDLAGAERTAREALGYEARLLPTTRLRLARTLLLARASLRPEQAGERDRELLQLGLTAQRERPHDPEAALCVGIAHNFLGDFAAARTVLTPLATALRDQPVVAYHLGWARLATGDAAAACEPFERAAVRLPAGWVLLPRAIALHEAGRSEALRTLLASLRDDADQGELTHQVLAMLAAQALLRGDVANARTHLTADLQWLLHHPLLLQQGSGEFAERGAVLIRLGGGDALPPILAAAQAQHPGTPVADACAFLGGMLDVLRTGEPATAAMAARGKGGDNAFSALLAAFGHERRGEIADMQTALSAAARLSSSPLTKALLAHGLRAAGRSAEADNLTAALRREMTTLQLRRPPRHPLLAPELAYAYTLQ